MKSLLAGLVLGTLALGGACDWALVRYGQRVVSKLWLSALLLALASLLLLTPSAQGISVQMTWISGLEPVSLRSEPPASYLAVLVFWALGVAQWLDRDRAYSPQRAWETLLAYLLAGLAVTALTVDSFLARIILLDLLSLLTTAALWPALYARGGSLLWRRYLVFRMGDLSLLAMVLWLSVSAGTLQISALLGTAATLASDSARWILWLGVGATWIKLGLPPFHSWVDDAWRLQRPARALLLGVGLPLLGAYLLYRLQPALIAGGLRNPLIALGILAMLWGLFSPRHRGTVGQRLLATQAALAPLLVGTSVFPIYLLTFAPLRVAIGLLPALAGWLAVVQAPQPSMEFEHGAVARMLKALQRLGHTLEHRLLGGLLALGLGAVQGLSWWLHRGHSGQLRRNVAWALGALLALGLLAIFWFTP